MTNAVFIASDSSIYDDLVEERYHFPRTYLRQVEAAVGDWVVYYEPRRTTGPNSATGRQAYFAVARVAGVIPDPARAEHFYALIRDYLPFDTAVPFRDHTGYRESKLVREDGKTNKGAFGRAVRELPGEELEDIVSRGIRIGPEPWELTARVADEVPEYVSRSIIRAQGPRRRLPKAGPKCLRQHLRRHRSAPDQWRWTTGSPGRAYSLGGGGWSRLRAQRHRAYRHGALAV